MSQMFNKWEDIVCKMYELGTLLMLCIGCEVPYNLIWKPSESHLKTLY